MKILENYIAKQVLFFILLVSLVLIGLDLFFNLVHELKVVGRGNYHLSGALSYLFLTMPGRFYSLFPWAALIGTVIGLGMLASHSELVVMRTSSVSIAKIIIFILKTGFILVCISALLGEVIAPLTERLAQQKKTLALSAGQTVQTAFGLWVRQKQAFIHVNEMRSNGELIGVTRYQFDNAQRLTEALFAESAMPEDKEWVLRNVQGTRFSTHKLDTYQYATVRLSSLLEQEVLETAMIKHPERLSIVTLYRTIHNRLKNKLNAQSYELALFTKLFQPLVILMMMFLAIPFVFGPLRSVSMGFRIVVGIGVAFLFNTVNSLFAPVAVVYHLPPFFAVVLPILIFSGIGMWILRRVQ